MPPEELILILLEKIAAAREIAIAAYTYADRKNISLGQRRAAERLGIRAVDLIRELATFIHEHS